jgi:alpha-D-xyloside xylohydrolase
MKFSNGCWVQREGVECFSPAEVYETRRNNNSITFCAPTHKIIRRGDTLGGPNLTIKISAPAPEVLRVQTFHYMGVVDHGPNFEISLDDNAVLSVEETEDAYKLFSGSLNLSVNKQNAEMQFNRGNYKLTASNKRDKAYVKTAFKGLAYETDNHDAYMREQLGLSVGELIYGLGERFTPFVKNGQSVDLWNEDGGTSTEISYKNIPFYLSNRGYGIFVNSSDKVSFEISSEMVKKVGFSVPGESLDYFIFNGPAMKDAISRYTDLTGKPALPAPWTFGLWLSTSFTTNYDEATVTSFVDGMAERDIPLSVFHFDCFWMKGFNWCDFKWDKEVFPDPSGMLKRLKEKGLKICVWINSYIAQESILFEEGMKNGYFVKRTNGDVWQWDMWQPGMALVDFTNPAACEWYASKLEELMDMGVDCFKTDFGERIPTKDVVYYNGADPVKMHNYYTYLYNKTVFGLVEKKRGKGNGVVFARSATAGGQKFPVHWGGDCWSDFESMSESLRGGLSLTMSGFGFWSHDIGGFEDTSTPDVYKRWVAFGLMSSHSRLHGSSSYRVPWAYDEEAVEVARFFTKLKASLMPYLYGNAVETNKTGIPTMRSMVLEFQDDPACQYLDKQYMLGGSLLIAPVLSEESMGEFYVPQGSWTNFLTGEKVAGGRWVREHHGYLSIPCLVRENSIIAVGAVDTKPEYDYAEDVTFKIYELTEGIAAKTQVYNTRAELELSISVLKEGNTITVSVQHFGDAKPYKVYLHAVKNIASVTGGTGQEAEKGTVIIPSEYKKDSVEVISCKLN